jgi:uncharacterized protein YerC
MKLSLEITQTIKKMLDAGVDRQQIALATGIALPQISTVAICFGHGRRRKGK